MCDDRLADYETELQELRLENEHLRRSAAAFGELAERLSRALGVALLMPLASRDVEQPPPVDPPRAEKRVC